MKFLPLNYLVLTVLFLEGCATVPKPEPIGEVVSLIKQQYVDDVPYDKLVAGCRNGIKRDWGWSPDSRQLIENKPTDSTSVLLDIAEILTAFKQQSPEFKGDNKLETSCLKGIANLDRQSAFLDEEDFKELTYTGGSIGIEYSIETDFPKITSIMEDSPAERAGLKAGDIIISIDLVSTKGLSLDKILKLVRGTAGTNTILTVERMGTKEPIKLTMQRDVVRAQSVKWQSLGSGFAYIRIERFQASTPSLFAKAIDKLYVEDGRKIRGLILDLRNNLGGLLTGSIAISSAFLPSGSLVTYATGRTPESNVQLTATPADYGHDDNADAFRDLPADLKTAPLVVLVNKATCSGAEIVAAALQDHKRAKLVGTRTFSQGTIATIFPLNNKTALKLTTAKLYRSSGIAINEGVMPDTKIEADNLTTADFRTAGDMQFNEAFKQLKEVASSRDR